ncbi:MAG: hypothetical protein WC150_07320 [Bacteroidia bacterium]
MKNKYSLLLLFVSFCCLNVQCKKESELDKLPPATTSGAQTMGCLVNGEAFTLRPDMSAFYYAAYYNGTIEIQADNQSPLGGTLILLTRGIITKPGYYLLPFNDGSIHSFGYIVDGESYASRYTPSDFAYMKITRLDSVRHYMAGEFSFTLYNRYLSKSVKITHGRFDFKYAP